MATLLADLGDLLLVEVRGAGLSGDGSPGVHEGDDLLLLDEAAGEGLVPGGVAAVVGHDVLDLVTIQSTGGVDPTRPGLDGPHPGGDDRTHHAGIGADGADDDWRL